MQVWGAADSLLAVALLSTALDAIANNIPAAQSHQFISTVTSECDQDVVYRAADSLLAVALLSPALAAIANDSPQHKRRGPT